MEGACAEFVRVAAELVDLNGDRRTDLFVAALSGIPPEEERVLRVYLQGEDGKLPAKPDHVIPGLRPSIGPKKAAPFWAA